MNFAIWAGTMFPPSTKFLLITGIGKEHESVIRLARIGYDSIVGVLKGGVESYKASGKPVQTINSIGPTELTPDMIVYDVRNPPELEHGHVENARNVPLIEMSKLLREDRLSFKFPHD